MRQRAPCRHVPQARVPPAATAGSHRRSWPAAPTITFRQRIGPPSAAQAPPLARVTRNTAIWPAASVAAVTRPSPLKVSVPLNGVPGAELPAATRSWLTAAPEPPSSGLREFNWARQPEAVSTVSQPTFQPVPVVRWKLTLRFLRSASERATCRPSWMDCAVLRMPWFWSAVEKLGAASRRTIASRARPTSSSTSVSPRTATESDCISTRISIDHLRVSPSTPRGPSWSIRSRR